MERLSEVRWSVGGLGGLTLWMRHRRSSGTASQVGRAFLVVATCLACGASPIRLPPSARGADEVISRLAGRAGTLRVSDGGIGAGTPVLFVHGLGSSLDVWNSQLSFVRSSGRRAVAHDQRPGGRFLLSMKRGDGETIFNSGHYTEVVPSERIVSSLSFSDASGLPTPGSEVKLPGVWPDAITVAVAFKSVWGGKTHVAITETGVPLIMRIPASMGWDQQLDKLESLF